MSGAFPISHPNMSLSLQGHLLNPMGEDYRPSTDVPEVYSTQFTSYPIQLMSEQTSGTNYYDPQQLGPQPFVRQSDRMTTQLMGNSEVPSRAAQFNSFGPASVMPTDGRCQTQFFDESKLYGTQPFDTNFTGQPAPPQYLDVQLFGSLNAPEAYSQRPDQGLGLETGEYPNYYREQFPLQQQPQYPQQSLYQQQPQQPQYPQQSLYQQQPQYPQYPQQSPYQQQPQYPQYQQQPQYPQYQQQPQYPQQPMPLIGSASEQFGFPGSPTEPPETPWWHYERAPSFREPVSPFYATGSPSFLLPQQNSPHSDRTASFGVPTAEDQSLAGDHQTGPLDPRFSISPFNQMSGLSPLLDFLSQAPYHGPYGPVGFGGFGREEFPPTAEGTQNDATEVVGEQKEEESTAGRKTPTRKRQLSPPGTSTSVKSSPRKSKPETPLVKKPDTRPAPLPPTERRKARVETEQKAARRVAIKARIRPGTLGKARWKMTRSEAEQEEEKRFRGRRRKLLDEFESRMYYHYELPTVCNLVHCKVPELFLPPCLSTTPVYEFAQSEA